MKLELLRKGLKQFSRFKFYSHKGRKKSPEENIKTETSKFKLDTYRN